MPRQPKLVVLAGGASSRMWPLREKLLMRFGAEPLLVSQLQRYHKYGFEEAIVIASPDNQPVISQWVADLPIKTQVIIQKQPRGMGDAILQTQPLVEADTPLYIVQLHDVTDDKLHTDMLAAFKKRPEATYIAGYEREDYFPGGYLVVGEKGRITGIVEKPGPDNRPSNLVNIVAHLHNHAGSLFEAISAEYAGDNPADDHYERAMDKLMQTQDYRVVPYKGFWGALKYPWHVLEVMDYYLNQINGQVVADDAFIAPNATLAGNVFIGPGARVYPGAAVVGPAYIGAGTTVGNNALVRNSMVLNDCEVGFTTEVARSYVADNCSMHACRVLDSVFAPNVNFSAGCTTANLRIDRGEVSTMIKGQRLSSGRTKFGAVIGQEAFIAVDVMTMPGVKIGERANVGPGTHVRFDVLDHQRIYVKQQIQVVEDDEN